MENGAFVVSRDPNNHRDILFSTLANVVPSEEQLALKSDATTVLVALQMLFPVGDPRYEDYFKSLLSLTQCGLVGPSAQPKVAQKALAEFKNDLVMRQAGAVKNRHMRILGCHALILAGAAAVLEIVFWLLEGPNNLRSNLCLLWLGSMVGVWLSFGARKTTLTFDELAIPESDRVEPFLRLMFTGLLTSTFGLFFVKEIVVLSIGNLKSSQLSEDPILALLIGVVFGFSELALPSKLTTQAARFLDFK